MIGIYYIATGSYKVYIDGFIRSIQNFRINSDKKIILLVDDFVDISYYDIEIEQYIISDAPWPIVALLKMWYIYKYRENFKEIYYFNANAQVIQDVPNYEDKMLCTQHSYHQHILDGH